MLHFDRLYEAYPEAVCGFLERVHRIDGTPKEKLSKLFLQEIRERIPVRDFIRDAITAWRAV
jgi:electron transfer flavoprotein-quinone oxidoreductase